MQRCTPRRVSPEDYFEVLIPKILDRNNTRSRLRTCVIRLLGGEGGEWTIDLKTRKVHRGGSQAPDVYLEMDRDDFVDLMNDQLDVDAALCAGRIRFCGNVRDLHELSRVLQPAA